MLVVAAVSVPLLLSATIGLILALGLSSRTAKIQKLEADATAYAEVVKDVPYVECASPDEYRIVVADTTLPGVDSELTVTEVFYWDDDADDYSRIDCATNGSGPGDGGSQLVTVTASNWDLTSTLEVVKRDPQAAAEGDAP